MKKIFLLLSSFVSVNMTCAFAFSSPLSISSKNNVKTTNAFPTKRATKLLATKIDTKINGDVTGKVREALRKMRGLSVSVEFTKHASATSLTDMEMEMLSLGLRKAKAASIFTSDLDAIEQFAKEQQMAIGNFPGPCPIIYCNDDNTSEDGDPMLSVAIDNGATAVVIDVKDIQNDSSFFMQHAADKVDVICRVRSIDDVEIALENNFKYAFLLSENNIDIEALPAILSVIPKDSIIIYSIKSMQLNSLEITKGKDLLAISSEESGSKINGLLLNNACIGDDEDISYTSFAVSALTKKSSSTFAMTGLTGSTNGHFGTMSDNISIENTKWKRIS